MSEHRNVLAVISYAQGRDEHLRAITERDIDAFARTVHEDVRLVGPSGALIEGRDAAVAAHRVWFEQGAWSFAYSILFSDEYGDAGWSLASVTYTSGTDVTRFVLFMLFVRTEAGTWELIYDQNTPLS